MAEPIASETPIGTVARTKVLVEFTDQYGETRVIHRNRGTRLAVKRQGNTPAHALNRAAAVLLGQRIRAARKVAGLTLAQLCIKSGLATASPKQRMRELEEGERNEGMRLGTLYAIALALGARVADLMPSPAEVAEMASVQSVEVHTLQVGPTP